MLVIRQAQMEAMARAAKEGFVRRAKNHLQQSLPEVCQRLGEDAVAESVHTAIRRGAECGLTQEMHVLQYLNLMYTFGFEFDRDPQWGWMGEILRSPHLHAAAKFRQIRERMLGA